MEELLQKSPQLGFPIDSGDAKYVSGLSTILVATIQEAKDRISQIEYIFCSQLFPNFQCKSKSLQKIYSESAKAAEDAWREKEHELLLQIEKLLLEKKLILEENQSLKLEKAKFVNNEDPSPDKVYEKVLKELEEKNNLLVKKLRNLELEAKEIRGELLLRSKEVDEGKELQKQLLQLVQSKKNLIVQKEKQLKEQEEMTNAYLAKIGSLEESMDMIEKQLVAKTNEVEKEKELQENLIVQKEKQLKEQEEMTNAYLAKIGSLEESMDIIEKQLVAKTNEVEKEKELQKKLLEEIELNRVKNESNERLLNSKEMETKLLSDKIQILEELADELQKEIRKKTDEVEGGRKLQDQLLQQINFNHSEMSTTRQQLAELETDKKLLLAKIKGLEEKVDKLHINLRERSNEASEGMELHGKLLQEIEAKDSELLSEKKKRRDVIAAYKNLKSQHNFLRAKCGLTMENMLPNGRIEEDSGSLRHDQNLLTSPVTDIGNITPNASVVGSKTIKLEDKLEDGKGERSIPRSLSHSPSTSSSPVALNFHSNVKSNPLTGTKRPASTWRETRSHQHRGGLDPHDDFLDTPLENIKESTKRSPKEEAHDLPDPVPKDMSFDSSDDHETQDMNEAPAPQKPPVPRPGVKGFKYVEPVRKKAERENLKGIECKQCKKFYDAVLPEDGGKDNQQLRCEHHDGVSRHRYRYAPPLTPEGFWNIGFESEM